MKSPAIINIQKFSIHDGEGIRTTVFFKGCPLTCRWCHNPESQRFSKEVMFYADRCVGCGGCAESCPEHAVSIQEGLAVTDTDLCVKCGECLDYCSKNARALIGKEKPVDQLVKELCKDRMFYEESGGGVTLSGGEVMCQDMDYIEELAKSLYKKGVSVDIDTCGYAPFENYKRIIPYIDTFLYDIKAMNPEVHKKFVGVDNKLILDNVRKLAAEKAKINIRVPVIEGVNASDEEQNAIINFVKDDVGIVKVNLLPYHNTGKDKYERLGRQYEDDEFGKPTDERMNELVKMWNDAGFSNVKIGG